MPLIPTLILAGTFVGAVCFVLRALWDMPLIGARDDGHSRNGF